MLFDIDTSDPRPVFRQIVDEVGRCISIGVLKPDEALPAVRKLAGELKVNANTVQHAYRTLEQEGTVYVRRGLGTFISARAKKHGHGKQTAATRQIATHMLQKNFHHNLLTNDLIATLQKITPQSA